MTDLPASTAPAAAAHPLVQGRCPACNGSSLFLGAGGYVTCSRLDCPNPTLADDMLHQGRPEPGRWPAEQPGPRERHRARWQQLTPDQQAARLAELDEPGPAATEATGHVYLSTGCHHGNEPFANGLTGHEYCQNKTGILGAKKPARCKSETCGAPCICHCHTTPAAGADGPAGTTPDNPAPPVAS